MRHVCWCGLAAWVFLVPGLHAAEEASSGFRLLKTIPVGGEGFWDYLTMDSAAHRLYISRGTRVQVVDVDEGKVVGEVAKTEGVHGIALVPHRHRGFTSNGRDSTVTVFDTRNLHEVTRLKVGEGKGPDGIIYDPASKRVFTFNGRGRDATAIDAEKEEVVGSVKLGGKPESAAADGKGRVYVCMEDKDEIVEFDSNKLEVLNHWPTAPVKAPVGMAMDRKTRRLFISCHNPPKMVVMDADSGKVMDTLPIGRGTDFACFDPELRLAFSSNGDGTLSVIKEEAPDRFTALEPVKTQAGARTMALDTKTHRVYLVTAKFKAPPGGRRGQPAGERGQRGGPRGRGFGRPGMEPNSFVVLVVGRSE